MSFLWNQLIRTFGIFFRTIRAFFQRMFVGAVARVQRLTNFSRHATKVATSGLQSAVSIAQKPTKREDYVETQRLFISKSLLLKLALILIALGLVVYFIAWPFVLSHFLTARFFVEDRRVESWTGRAIVYADKKKTVPMYAGHLEDGVLQGEGKQYDDKGRLSYEGQFLDGLPSGSGTAYAEGVKIYEGQFAAGVYEGTGTEYTDGFASYDGQFSSGVYNGRGKRYENGVLRYEGNFQDGDAAGDGTAYYPSGGISYKGGFSAGVPDGTGKAYAEDGSMVYEGGFSEGKYSGAGVLYPREGQELDASFKDGAPEGVVQWKKNGRLYYEGEWQDGQPSGFGTLYNKVKKVIYEGQFSRGTLDGEWLLTLKADDLRAALGDGLFRVYENSAGGYLIAAGELGLTALCSFQTEEADSMVYAVYLSSPAGEDWVRLLPGTDSVPRMGFTPEFRHSRVFYQPPAGVGIEAGSYFAETAAGEDGAVTVLRELGAGAVVLVEWRGAGDAPGTLDLSAGSDADEQMEELLNAIDRVGGGAAAGGGGAAAGGRDPGQALAQCQTPEQGASLVDAMLLYWDQAEKRSALEENAERVRSMLDEAQKNLARGTGDAEAVNALMEREEELAAGIQLCQTQQKKAELQAQSAGVSSLSEYDLAGMLVYFNPGDANVSDLAGIAIAYAQATGKEADTARVTTQVKEGLVELVERYGQAEYARSRYEAAIQRSQNSAGAYATGSGTVEAWYTDLSAQADARSALATALSDFARKANELNLLTGGWVSRSYGWYHDEFSALFSAAIPEAPPEDGEPAQTEAFPAEAGTGAPSTGEEDHTETLPPETAGAEEGEHG